MTIAWVDVETTGLDECKERVLEIACILTDDRLVEIARFQCVTDVAHFVTYSTLHPIVQDMHHANGLWMESLRSTLSVRGNGEKLGADELFAKWLKTHCVDADGKAVQPQLGGSTISFDRAFLKEHLPKSHKLLHYRNVDTSTVNELAKRFWPTVFEQRPRNQGTKHRALDDIEESLWVTRYYVTRLGPAILDRGAASQRANAVLNDSGFDTGGLDDATRDGLLARIVDAVIGPGSDALPASAGPGPA